LQPVPTPNALPYGIAVNSGGAPFFAEFGSNKLASIDPATMTIHEYALPNPESRPRRIAVTTDDAIWYTDYAQGQESRVHRIAPLPSRIHCSQVPRLL
jgi:virginiamycin B lyase